MLSLKWSS